MNSDGNGSPAPRPSNDPLPATPPSPPAADAGPRGAVIALDGVSRSYRRGQETVHALQEVSISLRQGELTLILGPSGGGKSTLLHLLGGMDRPSGGRVVAGDTDISTLSPDRLSAWRRMNVGFVFQSFHLLPHLTALENVALPLVLGGTGPAEARQRAQELLERVGLGDRGQHRPDQLSGGQAQRVAVARALAADPPIMLADEPTGNLDSASGQEILTLLGDLARRDGRTVVIVSHNEEFAAFSDRVVRVRDGRVLADSAPTAASAAGEQAGRATNSRRARLGPRTRTLLGMSGAAALRRAWRSVLTGLGVTIGVAAMVLLVSIGAGLQNRVVGSILSQASLDSVIVSPSQSNNHISFGQPTVSQGTVHPIGPTQLATFARLPGARVAYSQPSFFATATENGHRIPMLPLQGLPPGNLWQGTGSVKLPTLLFGHLPTAGQAGVVLPRSFVDALFAVTKGQEASLVGRTVSVTLSTAMIGAGGPASLQGVNMAGSAPQSLVLTGVSKNTFGESFGYVRNALALHWTALNTPQGTQPDYGNGVVLAKSISDVKTLTAAIGKMGYGTTTAQNIIGQVQKVFGILETGLGVIGGIALAVAGLMIGVVMSMAVLERSREIGVLRALGARRRDVFTLFLSEAFLIGLLGGTVGDLLGWGLGKLGSAIFHLHGLFLVPLWLALLGLGFGGVVAVLAGLGPAGRAAKLNPVDTLRAE